MRTFKEMALLSAYAGDTPVTRVLNELANLCSISPGHAAMERDLFNSIAEALVEKPIAKNRKGKHERDAAKAR